MFVHPIGKIGKSLDNEIKKNKDRLEKLFNLYLDGKVDEKLYEKKTAQLESALDEFIIQRGAYTKSTVELLKYSENLFELFKMSTTLYSRLNNEKKRELLKLLCSNFSYDGENVIITIKKAFEPIVQIANLEKLGMKRLSCSFAFNGNSAFCFVGFAQSQNCYSLSSLALELFKRASRY